jgi:hypothetical protein
MALAIGNLKVLIGCCLCAKLSDLCLYVLREAVRWLGKGS